MRKMKLFGVVLSTGLLLLACGGGEKKVDTKADNKAEISKDKHVIDINTSESAVNWLGSLVGVYDHYGTLKFKSGNIVVNNGVVEQGSFVVDMTTMQATDDNFDVEKGSTKDKLIGHLSSPDFFNVEEFPEASFVIKSHNGNELTGDLTICGNMHEEMVKDVKIEKVNDKLVFTGSLVFDRQKYDVAWNHPMKDKVLKDDIELKIRLVE